MCCLLYRARLFWLQKQHQDGYDKAFLGEPVLIDAEECPVLPTILRNIFTELWTLKMWAGMTSQSTVIDAASRFKRIARRSVVDPFAINPQVDGRIKNIAESA